MKMRQKSFLIIFAIFFFIALIAQDSLALTEIFTSGDECLITILLRKQFHLATPAKLNNWVTELDGWIAQVEKAISAIEAQMNEFYNPGWIKWAGMMLRSNSSITNEWNSLVNKLNNLKRKLNLYKKRKKALEDIISAYPVLTDADIEALVNGWKAEIENKWTLPDYLYKCCKVNVRVVALIRKENEPEKDGWDQIAIVPGDFRSYIRGLQNKDSTTGFSNTPYSGDLDLEGAWSMNTIPNYTAPHEAGHEMGLDDQYEDSPTTGFSVPKTGREKDLMGGIDDRGNLLIVGPGFDNLKTILDARKAYCPPECCEKAGIRGDVLIGTRIPDTWRGPEEEHREEPRGEAASAVPEDTTPKPEEVKEPEADVTKAGEADVSKPAEEDVTKTTEPDTTTTTGGDATKTTEAVEYREVKTDDVTTSTAVHYKDAPAGGMQTDVYTLPTGKGADFRKWEVTDTKLNLDGEDIKPDKKEKFYVDRESYFRGAAATVFGLIGSQYKQYADKAKSGDVCHVTDGKKTRGPTAEAIDRAGMAAGLGLLASQAKGQLTGQKASFNLNKDQAQKLKDGKGSVKTKVENKDMHSTKNVTTPLGKGGF